MSADAGTFPLPPYGREVVHALATGYRGSIFIQAGAEGWRGAQERRPRRPVLVLPPGADPRGYCWPVDWADCIVQVHGGERPEVLRALLEALLEAGAIRVTMRDPSASLGTGLLSVQYADQVLQ